MGRARAAGAYVLTWDTARRMARLTAEVGVGPANAQRLVAAVRELDTPSKLGNVRRSDARGLPHDTRTVGQSNSRDVPDMNSPPSLIDPQELSFQLSDVLDVEALTRRTWFADHDRATFDSALETARTLAERQFRPHHRKSDLEEPQLVDGRVRLIPEIAAAIEGFARTGLLAAHQSYAVGGIRLPWVVAQAL